ncbi:MAG: hypothetical protein HQK50_10890 [Oligoflexia bacterium]|nr:hypothetical protein [Oligoflexia bacterium]MBF0366068.1 hypothetical protein [Oligoflexia bacterium]
MKIKVVQSFCNDPYQNLALEQRLFKDFDAKRELVFMVWINSPCVVIGRFQNPLLECNLLEMRRHAIPLVRRCTGGGTVFHDLGNLNFSFLSPKDGHNKGEFLDFVVDYLNQLSGGLVTVYRSSRDDLMVDNCKCSGSAFRMVRDKVIHHGTLLISANLELLRSSLKVPREWESVIVAKGVRSVRAPVINLQEVMPKEMAIQTIADGMGVYIGERLAKRFAGEWEYMNRDEIGSLGEDENLYRSRAWIYDETPKFTVADHDDNDLRRALQLFRGE